MATNETQPPGRDRRVSISQLPDATLKLGKNLYPEPLHFKTTAHLAEFRRAADYISAAMIFLRDNALLERDLSPEDIKHIIGYWGISPGITLIYAHINLTIQKFDQPMICLIGANYGVPAVLSCLWLERSLERFYPQYSRDRKGLHNLITGFSVPGGFPSHISARIPGCIYEGGDLGHVLSVAYGTIMDKPELITVAVIGDGEAETGPTATAWHMCKYINPTQDGALLPILYMSSAEDKQGTIFGSMDDAELCCLFSGYGYRPCIVDDVDDIDRELSSALYWAVEVIKEIQLAAKAGEHDMVRPRWPIIILRLSRRWGYPLLDPEEHLSGSFHGREVLLPHAKINQRELQHLQDWLKSYKPAEILQGEQISEGIEDIIAPNERLLLGQNRVTWDMRRQLDVPEWRHYAVARGNLSSCLKEGGRYLDDTLARNKHSLRIFSPDGLMVNKLSQLDKISDRTFRSFRWDANNMSTGDQVIEFASEHTCQGLLQGYTMTGRTGIFAADESLFPIIATMMAQYGKFLRMARETGWRQDLNSLTYISTSTWTRPEANGLSHQNPSFIGSVLNLKPTIGRVYLPPDANTFLCTLAHCLRSKNYVNLIVSSSHPGPVWFGPEEAEFHCRAGGGVLKWASTDEGIDPDVVLVGIGADATFEVLAASAYLRRLAPAMSVRVVNVTDLMILGREGSHPHSLGHRDFDILFTPHRDIHFNYHGYANELQGLLFGRPHLERVSISSFPNEVTSTTPFETMLKNKCSRYHVAEAAVRGAAKCNPHIAVDLQKLVAHVQHERVKLEQFIEKHGVDPAGVYDAPRFSKPWHRHRQPNGDQEWSSHDRSFHVPRDTD